jgi:hypothetical protein
MLMRWSGAGLLVSVVLLLALGSVSYEPAIFHPRSAARDWLWRQRRQRLWHWCCSGDGLSVDSHLLSGAVGCG